MIEGIFRDDHPRITLTVRGQAGKADIEFIVDTGFYGDLSISNEIARPLGLMYARPQLIKLASSEHVRVAVHIGTVTWIEGDEREVEVLILEGDALIGTTMLAGALLQIEGQEDGIVSFEPLD